MATKRKRNLAAVTGEAAVICTKHDDPTPTHGRRCRWRARASLGVHPARDCEHCGHRHWVPAGLPGACERCGGPLGPQVRRKLIRQETFGDRRTAVAWREGQAKLRDKGPAAIFPPRADTTTVAEHFAAWFERRMAEAPPPEGKRPRPRTMQRYRQLEERWVRPVIGSRLRCELTRDDVQEVIHRMQVAGAAPYTQRALRNLVHVVFKGRTPNPAEGIDLPRLAPRRPSIVPTYDDALRLVDTAAGTEWELPIAFALATGWRRSEICGLQWDAVDLDGTPPTATVKAGLHRVPNSTELELLPPKTTKSARVTPLVGDIVERLRGWSTAQKKQRLAFGPGYIDNGFVFTRPDGRPLDPDSWRRALARFVKVAGLPKGVTLHRLRSAVISHLAAEGLPLTDVAAFAGHSSTQVTEAHYVQAFGSGALAAAEVLARRQ